MEQRFRIGQLVRLIGTTPGSADQHRHRIIDVISCDPAGGLSYRVRNMNGVEGVVRPYDIKEAPADAIPQ